MLDSEKKAGLTRKWRDILEGRSFRSGSSDDDGVLHGVVLLEGLDKLGDGGSLLTNGNVDAVKLLALVGA